MKDSPLSALHEVIRDCVIEANGGLNRIDCQVVWAPECRGDHRLPLFSSDIKSWVNQNCHVDGLVIMDGKVRLLFEIDESDFRPLALLGKFLATYASQCFIHWTRSNRPVPINDAVLFQIVNTSKLSKGSWKKEQFKRIEGDIKEMVKESKGTSLNDYRLLCGTPEDFGLAGNMRDALIEAVRETVLARCVNFVHS